MFKGCIIPDSGNKIVNVLRGESKPGTYRAFLKGNEEKAQEMKEMYIRVFNMTNQISKIKDIDL